MCSSFSLLGLIASFLLTRLQTWAAQYNHSGAEQLVGALLQGTWVVLVREELVLLDLRPSVCVFVLSNKRAHTPMVRLWEIVCWQPYHFLMNFTQNVGRVCGCLSM